MCECLQNISDSMSKKYNHNNMDACVQVSVRAEISIKQWVVDKRRNTLKRSQKNKYEGVSMNFCPVCGVRHTGYQQAQTWNYL